LVGWALADSEAALENLAFQLRFSSRLLNYHRKSWKLHDCHKRPASLKNGTLVCCWMGPMGPMGRMGRMIMGLWDSTPLSVEPPCTSRTTHYAPGFADALPQKADY